MMDSSTEPTQLQKDCPLFFKHLQRLEDELWTYTQPKPTRIPRPNLASIIFALRKVNTDGRTELRNVVHALCDAQEHDQKCNDCMKFVDKLGLAIGQTLNAFQDLFATGLKGKTPLKEWVELEYARDVRTLEITGANATLYDGLDKEDTELLGQLKGLVNIGNRVNSVLRYSACEPLAATGCPQFGLVDQELIEANNALLRDDYVGT